MSKLTYESDDGYKVSVQKEGEFSRLRIEKNGRVLAENGGIYGGTEEDPELAHTLAGWMPALSEFQAIPGLSQEILSRWASHVLSGVRPAHRGSWAEGRVTAG